MELPIFKKKFHSRRLQSKVGIKRIDLCFTLLKYCLYQKKNYLILRLILFKLTKMVKEITIGAVFGPRQGLFATVWFPSTLELVIAPH